MNLPAKTLSALGQLIKNEAGLVSVFKNGDLVEGKIIKKTAKAIYFDLGPFGTGIVYGSELMNAQDVLKNLKVGDVATAKVVDQENDDGYVELSLREVGKQKAWQEIKELKESGELMTVKISGSNSGGLTTEINQLKAFIPVSQLATDHFPKVDDGDRNKISEELKKLIGLELKVKIIDVNPRSNKIIVSERETASENIKELLTKYKVGDVIDGIISGVADFGAFLQFVDNPKVEGMIHISELDHRLIENPKEVVKIAR
ncbi:MAG: RNA binding S1 domain protein [Parcubacteria group bacterium GW2011_GWA2_47_8b]|nr:MAG: RNA binding S1 domain protein [Parcubacteria group bacterium GW2011_GWA2_47_8b]